MVKARDMRKQTTSWYQPMSPETEQLHHVCQREHPLWLGNEQATPDRDFGWKHVISMEEENLKKNENAKNEQILEADLEYPVELHE